jgi:isohexenylglutaconyl-CoA hydratase
VNGSALGGGVGFVAASDFAFAHADAVFRLPEVTLGLPPAQVAPFVADRIGSRAALRRMLTAETISAAEALRIGLIDAVAEDGAELEAIARRTLDALGRAEPAAVRATKRIILQDRAAPRSATLDFAAERFAEALRSGTVSEGLAALDARRQPSWCQMLGDDSLGDGDGLGDSDTLGDGGATSP